MTNGIVFILHSAPDAAFAADLADAIVPHVALAMPFTPDTGARQAAYGSGATCVVLLDATMAAQPEAILASAPSATSLICRGQGVALPAALSGYRVIEVQGALDATATALRDAITNKQLEAAERNAGRRNSAPAPAMRRTPSREIGKTSMLTRSAWGLAATIVVAGIAAPAIGGRAGATSVPPDADPSNGATGATDVVTVAQPVQVAAIAPRQLEPPPLAELLEHIDASAPAAIEAAVPAFSAEEAAPPEEAVMASQAAPVDVQIEIKPDTLIAVVADAGQPKGGATHASTSTDKPHAAIEASKPSA